MAKYLVTAVGSSVPDESEQFPVHGLLWYVFPLSMKGEIQFALSQLKNTIFRTAEIDGHGFFLARHSRNLLEFPNEEFEQLLEPTDNEFVFVINTEALLVHTYNAFCHDAHEIVIAEDEFWAKFAPNHYDGVVTSMLIPYSALE